MTYYMIRHKASGEFMPQAKRDKGYSHWNPSNPNTKFIAGLSVPRLIDTKKRAARCIIHWAVNPNARRSATTSYYGEQNYIIDTKPDGRTKNDLEIVEIDIVEAQ